MSQSIGILTIYFVISQSTTTVKPSFIVLIHKHRHYNTSGRSKLHVGLCKQTFKLLHVNSVEDKLALLRLNPKYSKTDILFNI